ncbi:alkaline phosphatase PafA [Daejeonella oryzae]|uniref:alkaline phosphatase PafA n=1 Tax=Daejeonella oryzae TaxID=1122943 RepID=UPI0003F96776|nr:alkaline phosphatase PafA [Daejeonella oryzae]
MKIKYLLFLLLFSFTLPSSAQKTKSGNPQNKLARPKLVVGIVVDQMRYDFLYRFYNRYESGGFKRLLNEGFSCENASIDYIPTYTAIGHSTVYTGSVPSIHGIAGNDFIIQTTGKTLYCTADSIVKTVGSTSAAGEMSPRNLLSTTVTDELKMATNFRSKVIGIAMKDRGAILPAGHSANAAYWFDDLTGNWISSTYYMNALPNWVQTFNQSKRVEKYMKQDWNTLYPISTYTQSYPDSNRYEGKFSNSAQGIFPIKTSAMLAKGFGGIRSTPYGNSITLDLAKAAIENEALGQNSDTDFLTVSFSSTDYIGHQLGHNSVEIEDTYLRLDHDLSSFFTFLDSKMGKGNYTVFLTSDHGAATNANLLKDKNIPAGLWPGKEILADLNSLLLSKYKAPGLVIGLGNYQVNLNNLLIAKNKLNEQEIVTDCIAFLKNKPGVAFVVNMQNIQNSSIPDELRSRIVNGYNAERSGAIQLILKPGWYLGYSSTGTTHGTWNSYDAHIPLLFMGWGINKGKTNQAVRMTDIAPTVSALLHIQEPNGSIGKPIVEVLK